MSARTDTLARLQGDIARLESGVAATVPHRVALGHAEADLALQGGLRTGALHEIHERGGAQSAALAGFALGIARRLTLSRGFVLWVRPDFIAREAGELCMSGFAEFGFDPRRLVLVRAQNAQTTLRIMADGLACNALSVVVGEIWGDAKALDLAASRKLTLTAGESGVTGLMLRLNAPPQASTAETRWMVRGARSPPQPDWMAWGDPAFDAELIRNRHGPLGRWIMNWKCDDAFFADGAGKPIFGEEPGRQRAANSQPAVATPLHRPHSARSSGRYRVVRYSGARG